jgi:CHAT domain-containing protein
LLATLGAAAPIAESILTRKGIVLDSLLDDAGRAQAKGGRRTAERIGPAGAAVDRVQTRLAADEALIELLRYHHYLGNDSWESRYGAVVLTRRDEVKWIPLASTETIDETIRLYRKSARGETDETTLAHALHRLYELTWEPIAKVLPAETARLVISPDGDLAFISFATLLSPEDRFLSERYALRYVSSGRDLLHENQPSPTALMLVYGDPAFGATARREGRAAVPRGATALRSVEAEDFRGIELPPLPGTAREATALCAQAKQAGWQAQMRLGTEATEDQFARVQSPRILHVATHGFFLPEIETKAAPSPAPGGFGGNQTRSGAALKNPMHRSGLALAGAQRTLDAWAKGKLPPGRNDGILTAEEVGGLDLKGTWLVTLSACDTGSGEARAGEGVMGLRRGFIRAGAQNLLLTLWPISDETTGQIMPDFYARALATGNAAQALTETQRDWLVKLRRERGLLEAVQRAGPFIMSSQGASVPASAEGAR